MSHCYNQCNNSFQTFIPPLFNNLTGSTGPTGPTGTNTLITSGLYLWPGNPTDVINIGQPFSFLPFFTTPGIVLIGGIYPPFTDSGTIFKLANIGRYEIILQLYYAENGSVQLYAGASIASMVPLTYTRIAKPLSGPVSGSTIIETTTENSFFSVNASPYNTVPLTIPEFSSNLDNNIYISILIKQIS